MRRPDFFSRPEPRAGGRSAENAGDDPRRTQLVVHRRGDPQPQQQILSPAMVQPAGPRAPSRQLQRSGGSHHHGCLQEARQPLGIHREAPPRPHRQRGQEPPPRQAPSQGEGQIRGRPQRQGDRRVPRVQRGAQGPRRGRLQARTGGGRGRRRETEAQAQGTRGRVPQARERRRRRHRGGGGGEQERGPEGVRHHDGIRAAGADEFTLAGHGRRPSEHPRGRRRHVRHARWDPRPGRGAGADGRHGRARDGQKSWEGPAAAAAHAPAGFRR